VITRTFSKAYGLAGLRIGYAISSPEIADILNRARLPFNVNSIATKAACAALTDFVHLDHTLKLNQESMQHLREGLKKLELDYIPSVCNFVTINVNNGLQVYQKLLHEGVIVRPLHAYDMASHIRVTLGKIEQNERFLSAIHKLGIK
jgi:histidinol-phosphate aminotransferase